jgi:AcrR family transcriptional regulator
MPSRPASQDPYSASASAPASTSDAKGAAERAQATDRRRHILAAALRVTRRTGMGGARMEAIAAEARVSKGTLYNYFDSKESLLLEMVVDRFRAGSEIVGAAMGQATDPAEALAGLIEGLGRLVDRQAADYPLLFQAWSVVAHAPDRKEELFGPLRELFRTWTDGTQGVLESGVASGVFAPDLDAPAVARAMTALVAGLLFRATFDPAEADGDALRQSLYALLGERLRSDMPEAPEGDPR